MAENTLQNDSGSNPLPILMVIGGALLLIILVTLAISLLSTTPETTDAGSLSQTSEAVAGESVAENPALETTPSEAAPKPGSSAPAVETEKQVPSDIPPEPVVETGLGGGGYTDVPSAPIITLRPLPEEPISTTRALEQALNRNLEIQIKVLDTSIASDQQQQASGAFNPTFQLEGRFEQFDRPQNTQDFTSTGGTLLILGREPRLFNEDNWRFKASLEGKLASGTEYEFFSEYDILENTLSQTSPLSLFSPEFQSFTGLRIRQPLLRNFGTNVNLAEIRVARKNRLISKLELRDVMLGRVSDTLIAYYDMIYLVQDFRLKQEEFDLALKLTEQRREALERGQISARELSRAESALAEVTEELIISRNKAIERQTQFIALTSDSVPARPVQLLVPTTSLPVPEYDLDMNRLLGEAFSNRPRYQIARETVEREQLKLVFAENQVWPQLDLQATAGYNGLAQNFTRSYDRAFREQQGYQWSVGAVFSIPIGNDVAIGKRNEARHRKEQALLNLRNTEMETTLLIQQLVTIIESNYDRLDSMRAFRANAASALETEEERLETGLTNELEVLKFRRDLSRAKVRETAALADLNKAYVKLYEITGSLLERQNIMVTK
jgi:outer membrane protein